MRGLAFLTLLVLAGVAPASAERVVLAWPPTFYDSAELIVHPGPATPPGAHRVSVSARGFSADEALPATGALRLALPVEARCADGLDACAIVVQSDATDLRVVLQSPDTNGVPDTLARTAHDTVRAPSAAGAGRRFVVLSAPNSPDVPEALSFASVTPVGVAVTVTASAPCLGRVERLVAAGEVLTLSCAEAGDDLSGAVVESDGPVAVFAGNRSASLPVEAGSGWSADLLLDAPPSLDALAGGTTWLVPPLPRRVSHEGLGDLVRCAAGEALSVRIRDERGRDDTRALARGEVLDLDSADAGGDLLLRLDADGALLCRQFSKSRAHRGTGDPAAIPLVPRELFTDADVAFAPDGYGEGTHLVVVAEEGAAVALNGAGLGGLAPAPGDGLAWTVVELGEPPSGDGLMLRLESDGRFGAWLFGQGGYKAHGLTVARATPAPPMTVVMRGTGPQVLDPVDETNEERWCDPDPGPLLFYEVAAEASLRLDRDGEATCLDWGDPAGG